MKVTNQKKLIGEKMYTLNYYAPYDPELWGRVNHYTNKKNNNTGNLNYYPVGNSTSKNGTGLTQTTEKQGTLVSWAKNLFKSDSDNREIDKDVKQVGTGLDYLI
jgi:hypothetical protein